MPSLTLPELRRTLHRHAEPSNAEERTARLLVDELREADADEVVEEIGGHGVAAIYAGEAEGPTVLLRSDMDALPIDEEGDLEYASETANTSHKCGHDGHMTILVGVARALAEKRPERGRVVLLFQPAEETGEGAARVMADPKYTKLGIERALALHNLPGRPMGQVVVRDGSFASASQGMIVKLKGRTSHAAEPHEGISPVAAAATIAQSIQAAPQRSAPLHECVQATVVGLEVGGPHFGTSPGAGRVMATLRAHTQGGMEKVSAYCEKLARSIAEAHGLRCEISWTDVFPATENDPGVVAVVAGAAERLELEVDRPRTPFAWSEDFGHFTAATPGALFGLGSGDSQVPLHHPDYDFPDDLIQIGWRLFVECLPGLLADELGDG